MRFRLFDYSVYELTQYNNTHQDCYIDATDLWIFQFLESFIKSGRMKQKIVNNALYNNKTFYCIQFSAILKDFPCFGFNDILAILYRFQKYQKGELILLLLDKNKDFGWFQFTDKYRQLLFNPQKEYQKKEIHNIYENNMIPCIPSINLYNIDIDIELQKEHSGLVKDMYNSTYILDLNNKVHKLKNYTELDKS